VPDIKTIKMKIQIKLAVLILFSSCTISQIQRPGPQIVKKAILSTLTDTVKVITVFSYSNSSNYRRYFKSRIAENQGKVLDSTKFVKELNTFLFKHILHYRLLMNPVNFDFVDSIFDDGTTYNDADNYIDLSYELSKNLKDISAILIIHVRFNVDYNSISISTLGVSGKPDDRRQIISHAILMNKGALLYQRSNVISSVFHGKIFYKKSISRVLNDAVKK